MNKPKYVLLRGIQYRNRFFCFNVHEDPTKLFNGDVGYEIIGYAETVKEAQIKLFGKSFTDVED